MPPKTKAKKKIKSGFCANGQCEGTKPTSPSGQPMKICEDWLDCACECHAMVTKMYEMAEMERQPPEQTAAYLAESHRRHAETQALLDSLAYDRTVPSVPSYADGTGDHPLDERPSQSPVGAPGDTLETGYHGTVTPRFAPTDTGRRARGQLEYDVLKICDEYVHDVYDWDLCTPRLVAERIGKINETEPPSTGAINAVWDRWEKIGFAVQGKKPSHFSHFEMDGSLQTLAMLKDRIKRDKKRSLSEAKRGSIRPRGR